MSRKLNFPSASRMDGFRTSSATPAPLPDPSIPENASPAQHIAALEASLAEHSNYIASLQAELKHTKQALESEKEAHERLKYRYSWNETTMKYYHESVMFSMKNLKATMELIRERMKLMEKQIGSKDAEIKELKEQLREEETPAVARMR